MGAVAQGHMLSWLIVTKGTWLQGIMSPSYHVPLCSCYHGFLSTWARDVII